MHAFDVLGDPVRRRIIELLASGEHSSGAVVDVIREEFGLSQPGVSQHLRVLREHGFATVRPDGAGGSTPSIPHPSARSKPGSITSGPSGANASMPSAPRSPEASAHGTVTDIRHPD
jgi:biotin operon repressor